MVWCGSKNVHQKDMCLKEIGLHAQNKISILGSTINIIGGNQYDCLMNTRMITLLKNKIYMRNMATSLIWIC